mmetsp:Transcript_13027/g.26926  ORF Transcript_13027/g.26926 Transcript_13027/m.26926 type:complete len:475 (+) Transcript_13027:271-1695(+)|eukprot:CAMPEP_0178512770 /NCGR_PEP_ID=MMETSP0696-20121128/23087_1 /TAXON_ID=265572 /ORGANISM="Extubocellulus spinifer, Strain CCMP396" /LENGTH=474 /DNA_ID=CAMNT_0020142661 /DNA_START=227 /DNA_END=1651 /DNA_ORIENTATION=+
MAKSKLKTKKSKKGRGGGGSGKDNNVATSGGGSGKGESKTETTMKPKEGNAQKPPSDKGESSVKKKSTTSTNDGGIAKPPKSSSKKKSSSGSGEVSSRSKSSKKRKKAETTSSSSSSSSSSDKHSADGGKKTKGSKKKGGDSTKPSAGTLALQKKWKETAEAMGGTNIVLNKAEGKKIIFDMLHDSFRPMNITEIHKELKGVVPSPVLKACLDEMTVDASGGDESDDAHDDPFALSSKKNKKKEDNSGNDTVTSSNTYVDSLLLKVGRNINTSLYYVNQEKLPHDGSGLPPDERNELIGKEQKSAHERDSAVARLRDSTAQTSQLLSEPTNKEATSTLAEGEKTLADLKERIEESRQHEGNEKKRATTKKRIQTLSDVWWKRRRLCKDFLDAMEDMTEGTINAKKCLAGDGQIELESDETVIKDSLAAYESRKARGEFAAKRRVASGLQPTDTFVAVSMDGAGHVHRVYANVAE